MADLLSRVQKYINSGETLKFAAKIEMPELNLVKKSSLKRKDDNQRSDKNDKRPRYDKHKY